MNRFSCLVYFLAPLMFAVTACSSSSSSSTTSVTGSVSAPGGSVAFNPPGKLESMFASIFGSHAIAGVSGVINVGAGVDIELIEVDASGSKVGATIASTTTEADGSYTLLVPGSYQPDSKYIIRATGTTESMDVRYTGATNNIDPVTDAVSDLITTTVSDLSTVSTTEVTQIKEEVDAIVQAIDPTSLSATALSTAIKTEVNSNEEVSNQLSSTTAAGSICGNVKDSGSNNLENITIVVRDFGDWVTRAKTKTDASGDYCVNVPDGSYILGALNYTTSSMAASEWWHTSGTKYSQFDAERITVSSSASLTRNFSLEDGARITGTVTAGTGGTLASAAPIEGVKVALRLFQNFFPVVAKKSDENGVYVLNVIPGEYQIEAVNQTRFDYASEIYDGASGSSIRYEAVKMTLSVGTTTNRDFTLEKGYKVSGTVLDDVAGNPVTGVRVRVQAPGGPSFRLRTNKEGKYRIWLQPAAYTIQSYGQSAGVDLSASSQIQDFSTQVGTLTMTVQDSAGDPVSQVKLFITDSSGSFIGNEITSSDGTTTLYSTATGNHLLYIMIDDNQSYASTIWNGKTQLLSGDQIAMTQGSNTSLGTVTLPDAGLLSVTVTSDATNPVTNYGIQLRSGGTGGANRFVSNRTLSNGNMQLSVPAGTYNLWMSTDGILCTGVSVTAGSTTSYYFRTDTDTCSATPF